MEQFIQIDSLFIKTLKLKTGYDFEFVFNEGQPFYFVKTDKRVLCTFKERELIKLVGSLIVVYDKTIDECIDEVIKVINNSEDY